MENGEDSSGQMSLMRITLENHGFAGLTEEADCFLEIEEENKKKETYRIHTDARTWNSGETTVLCQQIKLPAVAEPKKCFWHYTAGGWASAPVCQSECGKRACVSGHVSEQLFQRQCSEPESVRIMGKRVGRLDFPPK